MGNPSNEKASQPLGSTFSHSAWQSGGIWGNNSISLNSRRETINPRGMSDRETIRLRCTLKLQLTRASESDETSPSAVSGSAQLNSHSQAAPWGSRGGIWNQTGSAHPGSSSSGSTSPTRTRDNFQHNYADVQSNSHGFPFRPPVSQNGAAAPNRTVAPGPLDPSTSSFKYPGGFGDSTGDERGNSNLYASNSNGQLDFEPSSLYRRNSNDPTYANLGHSRQPTLTSRQPELSAQTPSHQYGDNAHYPFTKLSGHVKQQTQRPSISGPSITLPSELGRSNAYGFGPTDTSTHELEESFRDALSIGDNPEPMNGGYAANGQFNPNSQPFQLDPGSQSWQHDMGPSNSMGFNQNMPESSWDPMAMALKNARRMVGAGERGSPAGSSYRPSVNSPRGFSGTPNARADPWSRPGSRDPRMLQGLDRLHNGSQYLDQQPSFYPQNYYSTGVSQFSTPYDQYMQNPNFRSQVQLPGFGLPVNYLPGISVPARPSRDQDPGKGMRSAVLEEFRSNTKSNKRYELKVGSVRSLDLMDIETDGHFRISTTTSSSSAVINTALASSKKNSRPPTVMRKTKCSGKSSPTRFNS